MALHEPDDGAHHSFVLWIGDIYADRIFVRDVKASNKFIATFHQKPVPVWMRGDKFPVFVETDRLTLADAMASFDQRLYSRSVCASVG